MKQTRFQEGSASAQSSRPRGASIARPKTPENGRSWDSFSPSNHIEVNDSAYRLGTSRESRTYHGHSRNSSGDAAYTARPPQRRSSVAPNAGVLRYDSDGIRVYEIEQAQSQNIPTRDNYTPAHAPRNMPPPIPDDLFVPRTAPISIPTNPTRPPPIITNFHTTSPFNSKPLYSPPSYTIPEPPTSMFDNLRISSDPRSSRDTFHSHSTDYSADRGSGSRRRRGSMREEEFKFPVGSAGRDSGLAPERPRHQRRGSINDHTFLDPGAMSASHSRNPSEESVFPPIEGIPRRRGSLREQGRNAGYNAQDSYNPTTRPGVIVHQTAYQIAKATGMLNSGGGRKPSHADAPLPEIWIAVMGVTGSGKSTFIQTATGDRSVGVNHGLRSCTREVEVHSVRIDGFQVNLIDTPGFDDDKRSETEVLQTIATYLSKAYYHKVFLNGIIYVHSILQTRMGGSGTRSLGIFERLVGNDNMDNVLLVSNMWDGLKDTVNKDGYQLTAKDVGQLRERELRQSPDFWKNLIDMGARTSRHRGDSYRSAHELIRHFLYPEANNGVGRPMKLELQKELVDQAKRLEETEVGKYINARLYEGQQKLEKEIAELRRKQQRALEGYGTSSKSALSELGASLEDKKRGLNDVRKKAEILGRRVDQLVDEQGNSLNTPTIGRTNGSHAGLCNVM